MIFNGAVFAGLTFIVGRAILPAAAFQAGGPAGKRVRGQDWPPHTEQHQIVNLQCGQETSQQRAHEKGVSLIPEPWPEGDTLFKLHSPEFLSVSRGGPPAGKHNLTSTVR